MSDRFSQLPVEQQALLKVGLLGAAYYRHGRRSRGGLYRPLQQLTGYRVPSLDDETIQGACLAVGWVYDWVHLLPVARPLSDALQGSDWHHVPLYEKKSLADKYHAAFRKMGCKPRQQHAQAMLKLAQLRSAHPVITEIIHRTDILDAARVQPFQRGSLLEEVGV